MNHKDIPYGTMNILEKIKEPTLLITSRERKKKILLEMAESQRLYPVKIMSLEEFLSRYFGVVSREAMPYLLKREQKKVSIIEEELSILPYLEKKTYESEKLMHLVHLKEELEERGWIEKDAFFPFLLKNRKILVYGYVLDPFYQKLFQNWEVEVIEEEPVSPRQREVYEFPDIEQEIGAVGGKIIETLRSGVPIQNIKIVNLSKEYKYPLHRLFSLLHIPVETEEEPSLGELRVGRRALELIKEKETFQEVIDELTEEMTSEQQMESVIQVFNEYAWYEGKISEISELLARSFEKKKVALPHRKNKVSLIRLEEVQDEDICFLLGFNKENFPVVHKDEDFLTDKEKQELGLWTSDEKNKIEKETLQNSLFRIPQLTITYKKKSAFDEWNPSLLIEELGFQIVKKESGIAPSNDFNEVLLSRYLDKLNKYGVVEAELPTLYQSYSIPYMTFDNQFKGIDKEEFQTFLNHKLLLSYSSIDHFFRCQFRYYLSNILKLDSFEETFATRVGTIFHAVLEQCLKEDFDFDRVYQEEKEKYSLEPSEIVLLNKLREELLFDIAVLKKQKKLTDLTEELHEKKFYLPVSKKENVETTFMGIVDKILYTQQEGKTYLSVIDYKTGTLPDNLNHIPYGIGMQLPVYLYLIEESHHFEDPIVIGIFLQKIINKEIPRQKGKDYKTEKEKNLRLVGYAREEEELLEKLDETYQDSHLIQGLKKGKNGFYAYSKVLSKEKMKKREEIVKERIAEADEKIREGDFSINPKRIGKDLVGCEFCRYKDICFHKEENIVSYKKYTKLSFLGGEEDA